MGRKTNQTMYSVTITVIVKDKYGSGYAKSQRETLSTGENLDATIEIVSEECTQDVLRQTETRRQAESAAS